MARSTLALLLAVFALPARAQGPQPSGRLPPTAPPATRQPSDPPRGGTVQPATPPAPVRGAVLEQVSGTVREVDRERHRIALDVGGERVTLSLDRNTFVYTASGLGTVLDVVPGAQVRAGRNAEFVAYWIQVRPPAAGNAPAPTPGQGTGPAGGSAAPAAEPRGGGPAPGAPPGGAVGPGGSRSP